MALDHAWRTKVQTQLLQSASWRIWDLIIVDKLMHTLKSGQAYLDDMVFFFQLLLAAKYFLESSLYLHSPFEHQLLQMRCCLVWIECQQTEQNKIGTVEDCWMYTGTCQLWCLHISISEVRSITIDWSSHWQLGRKFSRQFSRTCPWRQESV